MTKEDIKMIELWIKRLESGIYSGLDLVKSTEKEIEKKREWIELLKRILNPYVPLL